MTVTEHCGKSPSILLLLLLLLLVFVSRTAEGLFLHTSSAIIRLGGGGNGSRSLFGYKVAVIQEAGASYLLVSDPVGYHPDTKANSGTVQLCPVGLSDFNTTGKMCSTASAMLPFNFANPDRDAGGFVQFSQFGASLTSLPDGQFVVCAPGHNFVDPTFNHTATPGLCAYWRSVSAQPVWLHKFFPHNASSKDERMFGNCLGGFQVELTSGHPGVDDTRLTVSGPFCMLQRLAYVPGGAGTFNMSKLQPVRYSSGGIRNNYLGYSLASDKDAGTVFAASPFVQHSSRILLARLRPASPVADCLNAQIGRPFYDYLYRAFNHIGYASAVINATSNGGRKALVMGAPFQSEGVGPDGVDRGCVFVLPLEGLDGAPIDAVESARARYCGVEPGGRLGTSVVSIGDVNYDGSEDFAVGCPGCGINGTGAVYLFLGFADYANPPSPMEPFEIVCGPDVSPLLAGLGWSLAVAADLDGNTVDELVIGAIASRHVVVLPGRLLLDTKLKFRYADRSSAEDEFQTETPVHLFSRRMNWPIIATIDMSTKPGIELAGYGFNLQVNLEELAESELQRRFQVELLDCPTASADGWCQLDRVTLKANAAQFAMKFRLRALANNQRHAPPDAMLRDLSLRVRWRMIDRALPAGARGGGDALFPAILHERRVFPGYEDAFQVRLYKFTTGVCDSNFGCSPTGNLRLKLVGEPNILLNSYHPVTVTLLVQKASSDPYYGGTALRLTPSLGVLVRDNVTLRVPNSRGRNASVSHVRYWSEHDEVLLTEPFPDPPDLMTRDRRGQLEVTLRLNFDARRVSYKVGFQLVNLLGDVAGFKDYVTRDTRPMDNWATLEVKFNTSLSLRTISVTDEQMVADARASASDHDLRALTGTAAASVIGPGLEHTYELLVSTRPAAPVRGLALVVRVPLVTSRGRLLLYFPKNAIASHTTVDAGRVSQYLPGVPFTSNDLEGFVDNKDRECQPLEEDLAGLLSKPGLTLLESQHEGNVTLALDRERRDAGASRPEFLVESTTQPSSSDSTPLAAGGIGGGGGEDGSPALPIFDCDRPDLAPFAFRCVTFRCAVRDLGKDGGLAIDRVYLHLHARLWSPTYFRRHLGQFKIRSSVSLTTPAKDLTFRYVEMDGNASVVQTFLFLGVKPPMVDRIPWGYIVLAIFLGIWLLLLLILLLWYCNFFRRKRYDYNTVPQKDKDEEEFYQ